MKLDYKPFSLYIYFFSTYVSLSLSLSPLFVRLSVLFWVCLSFSIITPFLRLFPFLCLVSFYISFLKRNFLTTPCPYSNFFPFRCLINICLTFSIQYFKNLKNDQPYKFDADIFYFEPKYIVSQFPNTMFF